MLQDERKNEKRGILASLYARGLGSRRIALEAADHNHNFTSLVGCRTEQSVPEPA